jgi:MFS transporter, DHA2 family, multidrug resistance protein
VALPTISRDLNASTQALQWVVDAYTLVFAGLLLLAGNLGDRLGRRRTLQLGRALFGLFSVGAALAQNTGELIAARVAMGAAAAFVYPATLAILNGVFTVPRQRATAIGIWSAVSGLAVAIGPLAGGALLEHFSWSSVFYVSVPVAVIAVVAGRLLLPESRDPNAGRFDPLGALLSIAGITLLTWSIIEAPGHGWGSPATLGGIGGSLVILATFAWFQKRRPDPMLDVGLFHNPRFSAARERKKLPKPENHPPSLRPVDAGHRAVPEEPGSQGLIDGWPARPRTLPGHTGPAKLAHHCQVGESQ